MKSKRILSLALALALCLGLSVPALADTERRQKSDERYSVTGGRIYFNKLNGTVTACDTSVTEATIPATIDGVAVTAIGEGAFADCTALSSVTLPVSITAIGKRAFANCRALAAISIPDSVNSIGAAAFESCVSLGTLSLGGGLASMGDGAFKGCAGLTAVTIPERITKLEEELFANCVNLKSVTLYDSIASVLEDAFNNCASLTDVYYGGAAAQWVEVRIDQSGNSYFLGATMHYSAAVAPPPSAGITVNVNGKDVRWTDAEPYIDWNDRTMVPLAPVAEALGLTVSWDGAAREASFSGANKTITFPIGSKVARTSEGGTVEMNTAAVITNDRTYAPVRYLAEYFGYIVSWVPATRTVVIL